MPFPAPYPRTKDGDGFLAIDLASDTGKKMVWLKLFTVKYQSQECMQGLLIQGTSMQSDTQHAPLLTSVCSFLCTVGAPDLVPFYQTPEVCSPPPGGTQACFGGDNAASPAVCGLGQVHF